MGFWVSELGFKRRGSVRFGFVLGSQGCRDCSVEIGVFLFLPWVERLRPRTTTHSRRGAMDAAIEHVQNKPVITSHSEWEESYRPLPYLFFGLLVTWMMLVFLWTLNTWSKRRWQVTHYYYSQSIETPPSRVRKLGHHPGARSLLSSW